MLFMSLCDSGVGVGPEHRGQQPGPTENILSTFPQFFPQRFCCFYFLKKDYTSQRTLAKSLKTLSNILLNREAWKQILVRRQLKIQNLVLFFSSPKRTLETTTNKDLNVGGNSPCAHLVFGPRGSAFSHGTRLKNIIKYHHIMLSLGWVQSGWWSNYILTPAGSIISLKRAPQRAVLVAGGQK